MSKNLKNKIYKMNLILVCSAILLTSCSKKQEEKEKSSTKKFEFVEKETNYKKDETTEVLIDAEIKKDDIVRSYKHGDHWHVFTKDGKEHITYTDPSKLGDGNSLSLVSVVSKSKLRGLNVTSILKHGDHWHVYTADGKEYLVGHTPEYVKAALPKEECEKMHAASGVILEAQAKEFLTSDILLLYFSIAE